MNKQEIKEYLSNLTEELTQGAVISEHHTVSLPPSVTDNPWQFVLEYCPQRKGFTLDLSIWDPSRYQRIPATQYQPAEHLWGSPTTVWVVSPFLTDCLAELEANGIDPLTLVA